MDGKPTVTNLLAKPKNDIVLILASIYEHSSWVSEVLVQNETKYSSIETITDLASEMKNIVDASSNETKLTLLRAHPDLCEKVGNIKQLTKESQEEQSRAGLDTLTLEELDTFNRLNVEYRTKFGFPFILAVRNATKYTVLSALQGRVSNTQEVELVTALQQVHKIAWMRLLGIVDHTTAKGFLTCHVLDTANGCPGTVI
jgi:2-oxo-4-hydroxy-4-carboxy-5-ureidoimidazoline decarboxylase